MSYSPRGGYDDRDTRDSWGRGSAAGARDDYAVPMDDPYANPRRPRSPDDDRRKRRRSPSPIGARGADTYIPSYHRDRSPPYRDRARDPYAAGGGYGAPSYPADRYDSRSYRGDFYDPAAGGQPGGYDRRQAPYNPPRSQLRPPLEVPYLVPFSYYRDWVRDEDHRLYDDKAKLEEAYKNYRSGYLYKAHQGLWTDIKDMAWCKEKYGIGEEEVNERKKLRERGRQGKMESFVQAIQNGDLDNFSLDQKLPVSTSSPPKKELKLEANEEAKINNPEATVKEEEEEEAEKKEGESGVKMEEDASASATADEENKKAKTDDSEESEAKAENGNENEKMEEDAAVAGESEKKEQEATTTAEGANNAGEEKKENDESQQNVDGNNDDSAAKKGDDDSILIPSAPTTLFIKSLSPEISRSDLEAHCKQVEGYDYIALGEPNPLKKFHRIGWVVFKPDANMKQAVEKLCESKINNFILHMHLADQATYQRTRVTPNVFATPARIKQNLQQAKQIVSNMESAELPSSDEDPSQLRGSQAIEERLSVLREKQTSELAEDDSAGPLAQSALEESLERKALDLYIQYLRSVFHTCFYCVCTSDFEEELTRRCVKHVRKQVAASKNAKEKEATWIKNFDEKIQLLVNREGVEPLDYGGENYADELTKLCKPNIQQEDEGKYRCKQCKKLFKAAPFVEKHILNKHSELIGDRLEQLKYFNNYVLDPGHIAPPLMDASQHSNQAGYPMNGNFYNSGVANTFGAFNQMFNPNFGAGAAYNMMGMPNQQFAPYGQQMFSPMAAGFNGGYPASGPGGYGPPPLSGGARALNDRIGDRAGGFGYDQGMRTNGGAPNKRPRRESGNQPPPPPRGAKLDPRAGRLHAYTDLDGPPASGGDSDMMLDY